MANIASNSILQGRCIGRCFKGVCASIGGAGRVLANYRKKTSAFKLDREHKLATEREGSVPVVVQYKGNVRTARDSD